MDKWNLNCSLLPILTVLTNNTSRARWERREREEVVHDSPIRKSRRLLKQTANNSLPINYCDRVSDSEDDKPKKIKKSKLATVSLNSAECDYETFPQASEDLDDFEFKNYAVLRAWRVGRSRDLDLEAYKICQNRTLCEVIRRRGNDPMWGKDNEKFTEKLVKDLLQCWGIGPSKVRHWLEVLWFFSVEFPCICLRNI